MNREEISQPSLSLSQFLSSVSARSLWSSSRMKKATVKHIHKFQNKKEWNKTRAHNSAECAGMRACLRRNGKRRDWMRDGYGKRTSSIYILLLFAFICSIVWQGFCFVRLLLRSCYIRCLKQPMLFRLHPKRNYEKSFCSRATF